MSELTNVARPYAKAAFDVAVEQKALAAWADYVVFSRLKFAKNPDGCRAFCNLGTAKSQAEFFIQVCAEQLNEFKART